MARNSAGTGMGARVASGWAAFAVSSANFLGKWYGQYFVPSEIAAGAEVGASVPIGLTVAGILSILVAAIVALIAALILYSAVSSPGCSLGSSRSVRSGQVTSPQASYRVPTGTQVRTYAPPGSPTSTAAPQIESSRAFDNAQYNNRAKEFNQGKLQAERLRVLATGNMEQYDRLLQLHRQLYEQNHIDPCTSGFFPEGCSQAEGEESAKSSLPPTPPVSSPANPPPPFQEPGKNNQNQEDRSGAAETGSKSLTEQLRVPQNAIDALEQIDRTGRPPAGAQGGGTFLNDGRGGGQLLPRVDASGNPISYREWDVNSPGATGRDAERIVTGSDGSAYYTSNHYQTFVRMR